MENNKFFIIIPLYNDWKSLWKLIHKIEKNIYNLNAEFYIIVVNDASTIKRPNIKLNLNKTLENQDKTITANNQKEQRVILLKYYIICINLLPGFSLVN